MNPSLSIQNKMLAEQKSDQMPQLKIFNKGLLEQDNLKSEPMNSPPKLVQYKKQKDTKQSQNFLIAQNLINEKQQTANFNMPKPQDNLMHQGVKSQIENFLDNTKKAVDLSEFQNNDLIKQYIVQKQESFEIGELHRKKKSELIDEYNEFKQSEQEFQTRKREIAHYKEKIQMLTELQQNEIDKQNLIQQLINLYTKIQDQTDYIMLQQAQNDNINLIKENNRLTEEMSKISKENNQQKYEIQDLNQKVQKIELDAEETMDFMYKQLKEFQQMKNEVIEQKKQLETQKIIRKNNQSINFHEQQISPVYQQQSSPVQQQQPQPVKTKSPVKFTKLEQVEETVSPQNQIQINESQEFNVTIFNQSPINPMKSWQPKSKFLNSEHSIIQQTN